MVRKKYEKECMKIKKRLKLDLVNQIALLGQMSWNMCSMSVWYIAKALLQMSWTEVNLIEMHLTFIKSNLKLGLNRKNQTDSKFEISSLEYERINEHYSFGKHIK